MRILHVIAGLSPRDGGPAKVAELAEALAARGNTVVVATTNREGRRDTVDVPLETPVARGEATILYHPVAPPRATAFSPGLACWLRRNVVTFDVAHVHGLYLFPILAAGHYCRRHGVPYIFQPHGGLNTFHRNHHRLRKSVYELLFERRNLAGAAGVRWDSDFEREQGTAAGVTARSFVIPPGTSIPDEAGDLQHGGWGPRIVFLGRLSEKKGASILIEAFARVASRFPDATLSLAGPDEGLQASLEELTGSFDIAGRVRFEGLLVGDRKDELLRGADVLVLPSVDESFGAAATEAMAYGVPVIVTTGVPIHGDIERAGAGVVTARDAGALANALDRLLADPAKARAMGREARKLVIERYSWARVAGEVEEMYSEVVAGS